MPAVEVYLYPIPQDELNYPFIDLNNQDVFQYEILIPLR